ncbi:coagulation factor IX-like [Polypterus senegalus]|uniref:coagulation factor IX-like n=1 Tax=Polypterus senegalus TaxID=55291 RepID=UPI0019656042|nr:coagulation factor IX-like [Polypterus senegalus]
MLLLTNANILMHFGAAHRSRYYISHFQHLSKSYFFPPTKDIMIKICQVFLILIVAEVNNRGCEASIFLSSKSAQSILSRTRRYNTGLFEELKPGNLERECLEERCTFEEAREIFEDKGKALDFWYRYVDGDQCQSSPCHNGGSCKDDIASYICWCPTGYQGKNCELENIKRCNLDNGGCMHFCTAVSQTQVNCSCAMGYKLEEDGKTCTSEVPFPCGRLGETVSKRLNVRTLIDEEEISPGNNSLAFELVNSTNSSLLQATSEPQVNEDDRIVGGTSCAHGEIPWQVAIINKNTGECFCGGSIINENWIVTAAHCFVKIVPTEIAVGETDLSKKEGTESRYDIQQVFLHPRYNYTRSRYNSDIALLYLKKPILFTEFVVPICLGPKDFTENLMQSGYMAQVSGWGRLIQGGRQSSVLQKVEVPYVDRLACKVSSNEEILSTMFCAGFADERKDACQGDSGGPHTTKYKDTHFLTGIVSWGEGCAVHGKYGIYTRVSRFYNWISSTTKK